MENMIIAVCRMMLEKRCATRCDVYGQWHTRDDMAAGHGWWAAFIGGTLISVLKCLYVRYVNVCERIKYANYIRMLYVYTHTSLFPHILQVPKTCSHLLPLLCRILPPCCCFNRFASAAFVWCPLCTMIIFAHMRNQAQHQNILHTHTPARRPG